MNDLESELTQALQKHAASRAATMASHTAGRYATLSAQGGAGMLGITKVAGMLPAKAAVGIAAATLAVGGGATAVAVTHAVNHGQTVVAAVKTCKAEYGVKVTPGATPAATPSATTQKENVGQCVSAVAREKGVQERALHSHGKGAAGQGAKESALHAHGAAASSGAANANSHKPSSVHPTGPPTTHPTGKPSGLPTTGR